MMRRDVMRGLAGAVAFSVGGCGSLFPPKYRFRMLVVVNTPKGERSGSSVMEISSVRQKQWIAGVTALQTKLRGEAVAVNLPGGQTVFALVDDSLMANVTSGFEPNYTGPDSFVESVAKLGRADLEVTFGVGIKLSRIVAQITNDPVTSGIRERLVWLSDYPEPSVSPHHSPYDNSPASTLRHGNFFRQG